MVAVMATGRLSTIDVAGLKRLRSLVLVATGVTNGGTAELRKASPGLYIMR